MMKPIPFTPYIFVHMYKYTIYHIQTYIQWLVRWLLLLLLFLFCFREKECLQICKQCSVSIHNTYICEDVHCSDPPSQHSMHGLIMLSVQCHRSSYYSTLFTKVSIFELFKFWIGRFRNIYLTFDRMWWSFKHKYKFKSFLFIVFIVELWNCGIVVYSFLNLSLLLNCLNFKWNVIFLS